MFERIEQARAEGCIDDQAIASRLYSDRELREAMIEEHSRMLMKEFRRYLKKRGLKERDLSEEQIKKIVESLFEASMRALIDEWVVTAPITFAPPSKHEKSARLTRPRSTILGNILQKIQDSDASLVLRYPPWLLLTRSIIRVMMDAKQVIDILRTQIANARARQIDTVTLTNLEAVLNDIAAHAESTGERVSADEFFKAQHASDIAGYQVQAQRSLEQFRSVIAARQTALRSFILINGAACVVLLAFLGHVWDKGLNAEVAKDLLDALRFFVGGVLLSTFATGTTCLAHAFREEEWNMWGNIANFFTIGLVVLSGLAFGIGGYLAYLAFLKQFS
jgi:hypothetical protein